MAFSASAGDMFFHITLGDFWGNFGRFTRSMARVFDGMFRLEHARDRGR